MNGLLTAVQVYGAIALIVVACAAIGLACSPIAVRRVDRATRAALTPPPGRFRIETVHEGVWVPWPGEYEWLGAEDAWWRALEAGYTPRIERVA